MTDTAPAKKLVTRPAFRLVRGDDIRCNNRRFNVSNITLVVFYPRNRVDPVRHGVKLALINPRTGEHATWTLENYDSVRVYR